MGNINTSGYCPERNGFISGISVQTTEQFVAGTGLKCRVYRNAEPTHCIFYITDQDNFTNPDTTAGGAKRTREFNTVPTVHIEGESEPVSFPIKAGERIEVVMNEAMDLTGYVKATNIHYIMVQIDRVYDITSQETLSSLSVGGGNISGGVVGGGGSGGDDDIGV